MLQVGQARCEQRPHLTIGRTDTEPSTVGRAGNWSPNSIGQTFFLFDANLGITLGSGGVSAWADQSGNGDSGRNALQAAMASQPAYTANDSNFNGQSSLNFDGSDDYLTTGTFSTHLITPSTLILVASSPAVGLPYFFDSADGASRQAAYLSTTSTVNSYAGNSVIAGTLGRASGLASVYAFVFDGASSAIYQNSSAAPLVTGNAGTNYLADLIIGARFSLSEFLGGSIALFVGWPLHLTTAQLGAAFSNIGARYGFSAS
jgi:hypothetical protein